MLGRITVWIAGLGFVGFGAAIALAPIASFEAMGLPMPDLSAYRIELRAFYGGLELGLGALLIYCALRAVRAGLWLIVASLGGIGSLRAVSMTLESHASALFWVALATELGLAALAAIALARANSSDESLS